MNYQKIGSFIGAKRREKNLNQEQLAERLGVSNKTISKWENGKCIPDYSVIEKLCEELDITLAELLDGEEKAPDSSSTYNEEQVKSLLMRVQELEAKSNVNVEVGKSVRSGITFGSALAMVISYTSWHSIGWAILHGALGWIYVVYYMIHHL
ncbi:MAG: helix-turn-helix transcriptional regulator [Clostridia bacterium]|nr:helix-turn-helix transcriptional regulator [Clostridia bacterium]